MHRRSRAGLASSRIAPGTKRATQGRPLPQQLQLNCPHLTFSSGAELSHCEQSGNQSLFTNQLSSAPRQRGRRLGIRNRLPSIFHGCCFFCFWRRATRCICSPNCRERELWLLEEQPRSWLRGNPWQCDFNLKSQISMPGTQAARALGAALCLLTAHTARAAFRPRRAPPSTR